MIDLNIKFYEDFSNKFCKYFLANNLTDYKNITDTYNEHYSLSKLYGNEWILEISKYISENLKLNKVNENIITELLNKLEFKINLNKPILLNIKSIIESNHSINSLTNLEDYYLITFSEGFRYNYFFIYANSFILNKMYNLLYVFKSISIKKDKFNFNSLFNVLNEISINGILFNIENEIIYFKIIPSKYSDFYLHFNDQLYCIYNEEKNGYTILNFIHSNFIYDQNFEICMENYNKFERINTNKFVNSISNDNFLDYEIIKNSINKNANFIYNFDYSNSNYNFSIYDIFCIKLLNETFKKFSNNKIEIKTRNLFLNYTIYNHNLNDVIDKNYIDKLVTNVICILDDYDLFIEYISLSKNNIFIIKELFLNLLFKINEDLLDKNVNEITVKNSIYSLGVFSEKNRNLIYKKLLEFNIENNKDFNKIFNSEIKWISPLIKSIREDYIIKLISTLISNNIKEEIIIKKIAIKYKFYGEKEIKNIINRIKKNH